MKSHQLRLDRDLDSDYYDSLTLDVGEKGISLARYKTLFGEETFSMVMLSVKEAEEMAKILQKELGKK